MNTWLQLTSYSNVVGAIDPIASAVRVNRPYPIAVVTWARFPVTTD